MLLLIYENLIFSGVHIGHTKFNTLFMTAWMLYWNRQNTWIINLFKTIYMFKIAFKCLKFVISKNCPIWFINLNKVIEGFVKFFANKCGEFFLCNYWINGMISNFKEIHKYYKISVDNFIAFNYKEKYKFFYDNWIFTRFTWPRFLFISNVKNSASVVRESLGSDIYCLGIVDTDVKSNSLNLPIPGNDESINSILFYNELISNYILIWKFKNVLLRLNNLRKNSKLISYFDNYYYKLNIGNNDILFLLCSKFLFNDFKKFSKINTFRNINNKINDISFDVINYFFKQNWRLFFLFSRLYVLKFKMKKKSLFKRKFRQFRKRFAFNFYYGRLKLRFLKYVLKRKYLKYLKYIFFCRFFSSIIFNIMPLVCKVYYKYLRKNKLRKRFYLRNLKNLRNLRNVMNERNVNFFYFKSMKNFLSKKNLQNIKKFRNVRNIRILKNLRKSKSFTYFGNFRNLRSFLKFRFKKFYIYKLKWIFNYIPRYKNFFRKCYSSRFSFYLIFSNIYKYILFYYLSLSCKKFKNNFLQYNFFLNKNSEFLFKKKLYLKNLIKANNNKFRLGFWAFIKYILNYYLLQNKYYLSYFLIKIFNNNLAKLIVYRWKKLNYNLIKN